MNGNAIRQGNAIALQLFHIICNIALIQSPKEIDSNREKPTAVYGAGGGGRTRTLSPGPDFESGTSANSITPAFLHDVRFKSVHYTFAYKNGAGDRTFFSTIEQSTGLFSRFHAADACEIGVRFKSVHYTFAYKNGAGDRT